MTIQPGVLGTYGDGLEPAVQLGPAGSGASVRIFAPHPDDEKYVGTTPEYAAIAPSAAISDIAGTPGAFTAAHEPVRWLAEERDLPTVLTAADLHRQYIVPYGPITRHRFVVIQPLPGVYTLAPLVPSIPTVVIAAEDLLNPATVTVPAGEDVVMGSPAGYPLITRIRRFPDVDYPAGPLWEYTAGVLQAVPVGAHTRVALTVHVQDMGPVRWKFLLQILQEGETVWRDQSILLDHDATVAGMIAVKGATIGSFTEYNAQPNDKFRIGVRHGGLIDRSFEITRYYLVANSVG